MNNYNVDNASSKDYVKTIELTFQFGEFISTYEVKLATIGTGMNAYEDAVTKVFNDLGGEKSHITLVNDETGETKTIPLWKTSLYDMLVCVEITSVRKKKSK